MKRFCITFVCIVVFFPLQNLFAAIGLDLEMSLLYPDSTIVMAENDGFGQIYPIEFDPDLQNFSLQLKRNFDVAWTDENFADGTKKMLSSLLSPILSSLLPCDNVLFSKPVVLEDGSKSFRIKNLNNGNVYSVILKEGKLAAMTLL